MTRRVLVSRRLFDLSPSLLEALRTLRDRRGQDDVTRMHDAFMLDPGLGPPTYLTSDGRIIWDDDGWGVVGTRGEALAAIAAGIQKTGVSHLEELMPSRPTGSMDCPDCSATGRFDAHGQLQDVDGHPFSVVCSKCSGLGWADPFIVLSETVLETG